jgi:pleckstrin homology domain-containing family A member 1/2
VGEDSEDDEEDAGALRTVDIPRAAGDSDIRAGYLWKKGERRKVCVLVCREYDAIFTSSALICGDVLSFSPFPLFYRDKQTWKRRWFVLRPAHLAYYKTSAEYQLHRLVDLQELHTCTPVVLKRRDNTFGVVTATRTYYLQAESQEDAGAWVAAIREAKEAQLVSTTTAAASVPAPSSPPIPIPGRTRVAAITPSPPSRTMHAITSSESEEAASPNTQRMFATSSSPAVPPSSSPRIGGPDASKMVMSGYITKMGKRRNWRKRWFLLNGEMLMYAGSHMVSKFAGIDVGPFPPILTRGRGNDDRTRRCTDKYRSARFWMRSNTMSLRPPRHRHIPEGDLTRWTTRCRSTRSRS